MNTMKIWNLIIHIYFIMLLVGGDSVRGTVTYYMLKSLEFKSQGRCDFL